jgi:hypothetical protein
VGHTEDPFNGAGRGEANITWTAPAAGTVDLSVALWYAANPGRSGEWTLLFNSVKLASGTLAYGGPYTRTSPATHTATGLRVNPGDVLKLQWVRISASGPMMGVNWRVDLHTGDAEPLPPVLLPAAFG